MSASKLAEARRVVRIPATITEQNDGWLLQWSGTDKAEHYAAAANALQAVKDMGRMLAKAGHSVVTVLTWEPKTRLGGQVVRALQDAPSYRFASRAARKGGRS